MTTLGDVADMLKTMRKESGLSQSELADRAGVARTTVTRKQLRGVELSAGAKALANGGPPGFFIKDKKGPASSPSCKSREA